ncbi:MAG: hypothetical protein UX44_C0002G0012 [candidate division WWE3 bacterium GW2011_GWA1_46_21]|uniref:Nucleoside 2-deoxyribosyltransferase n=4 Tax=Katanobacteria TaxID=422282 RepID=A0A0G1PGT2_UNCKA|nr:MAG: hypothetical protein UX44_C0002G0012 [candidate division WWE3 bacterium GW2011_GWA1_46_21]KKU49422.1 MAG: hypothetical protein UX69_C0001G0006 [candidate division WWE3 bacterium GW2011_GWA2_46_9]KKU51413.1 MAG: hypothetical protein UX73_C0002G0013 [candidate division WWE3 bacterium GW2011_GWC1_47_10]KKU57707.1 MAG: hypothetical protein UX79_C0006G0043 [candidate division WWE3 bacterium GW2011_GWB1_47_11]
MKADMKVFFTASYSGKKDYQGMYDVVVKVLKDAGCDVVSLEVQNYANLLGAAAIKDLPENEKHYLYIRKGIGIANAVIIESSVDNFRLGFESALSLVYNKPVLCLSMNKDYSNYIKNRDFHAYKYSDAKDLEQKVHDFILEVKKKHFSVRFNGYLTPSQMNYLKGKSKKTGKTVSELIREMVQSELDMSL